MARQDFQPKETVSARPEEFVASLGTAVIFAAFLFPPWTQSDQIQGATQIYRRYRGQAFLTTPPAVNQDKNSVSFADTMAKLNKLNAVSGAEPVPVPPTVEVQQRVEIDLNIWVLEITGALLFFSLWYLAASRRRQSIFWLAFVGIAVPSALLTECNTNLLWH